MIISGAPYQVVAHLMYRDRLRREGVGALGFMVNVDWARSHYFPEVTRQVTALGRVSNGSALSVLDEHGYLVAGHPSGAVHPEAGQRRPFDLLFFDPMLVALDARPDLVRRRWLVAANEREDPSLASALRGATRTLVAAAVSALTLVAGVALSARATQARLQLAELRSEFVSTVTHELKTPIATIRAIGDTLVSGRISNSGTHHQYALMVVQESKRLARLVDNLLAYSRLVDVTEAYSFEPLSLSALVDDLLLRFRALIARNGVRIHNAIPVSLPSVRADSTAMELLLDNLLDNSIRYGGAGTDIHLEAESAPGWVTLRIRDTGMGIRPSELKHVTRKFYRGRGAGSGGSGLGLAIVDRIVADHGGRMNIESAPGAGTTVTVVLPVGEEASA